MNDKPKVLMFGWELPPHNSGGLGVACYGLAKGLSQQGVDISFALPRRMKSNISFMRLLSHRLQNVEMVAINSLLKAYAGESEYVELTAKYNRQRLKMYGNSLYQEALRYGEMAEMWSLNQPHEIIHTHDWMTYPAGIRAREKSGKPMVAHVHATEYDRTGGRVNSMIAELEYQGMQKADAVITVSEYTKQTIKSYYGVRDDKITVVHNGIDLSEFEPMQIKRLFPRDKIVLFVGRLTYQKGVEYFLRAASQVLSQHPDTIFLVVGDGDMYDQLVMESADLGIGHRVVFTGFLNGDKLRACYQMADAFVMPSVSEPYGIVALEAIAAGTPVVVSKQSGVSEILTNVLKVDFWDSDQMARMLMAALTYPGLAQEMAKQARIEAAEMTWTRAAKKTLAVYRSLG